MPQHNWMQCSTAWRSKLPVRTEIVGVRLDVSPPDIIEYNVPPYETEFKIDLLQPLTIIPATVSSCLVQALPLVASIGTHSWFCQNGIAHLPRSH